MLNDKLKAELVRQLQEKEKTEKTPGEWYRIIDKIELVYKEMWEEKSEL